MSGAPASPQPVGSLFGRKASLVVADEGGNGLELSELRFAFEVAQWESATPDSGSCH